MRLPLPRRESPRSSTAAPSLRHADNHSAFLHSEIHRFVVEASELRGDDKNGDNADPIRYAEGPVDVSRISMYGVDRKLKRSGDSQGVGRRGKLRLSSPKAAAMWRSAIVIFAKTPHPGASKTRLCPPLDFDDAAELSRRFILDTASTVARVAETVALGDSGDRVVPFVSFTGDAAAMRELVGEGFRLQPQRGGTFGERLAHATADVFALGFDAVFAIDSDSPTLPHESLLRGVAALTATVDRVTLGPCDDGGYYCLGATRFEPALFEGITWSTERVAEQTRARAELAGMAVDLLPRWYDVDDARSLATLTDELLLGRGPLGAPASQSAAFLRDLERRGALSREAREIAS